MSNNVVKRDKANKQRPRYSSEYDNNDAQYYDKTCGELLYNTKQTNNGNSTADSQSSKQYINKQALLQRRLSSADTDVSSSYYGRILSSRKQSSIDTTEQLINLKSPRHTANKKKLADEYTQEPKYKQCTIRPVKFPLSAKQPVHIVNGIKWELTERYKFVDMIGSGSYGHVCRAYDTYDNKFVAIKRIHKVFDDLIDCKRILREIAILNRLDHPNIVRVLDILVPSNLENFDVLYVILEIAASDIKLLVRSPAFLNENHVRLLIFNLLCGVNYIHSVGIYHRDLKPANCLINRDCSVKICDFGLARTTSAPEEYIDRIQRGSSKNRYSDVSCTLNPNDGNVHSATTPDLTTKLDNSAPKMQKMRLSNQFNRQLTGHVVTRWYRAPELILLQEDYSYAVDVWSVGCIFAELLNMMKSNVSDTSSRSPLFPGSSCFPLSPDNKSSNKNNRDGDQLNVIFNVIGTPSEEDINAIDKPEVMKYVRLFHRRPPVDLRKKFKGASEEALDLLNKMLVFNPNKRITVSEALRHEFFNTINEPKSVCQQKVRLPFNDWKNMSEGQLRYSFLREIQRFHDFTIPAKIIHRS